MAQAGEMEVHDLRVEGASHYISYGGIVSRNCGFDELTQFPEDDYRYLFSRLRRPQGSPVPLRMRSASNPGNIGHEWVYRRFVGGQGTTRGYIPAKLRDNPHLDREEYEKSLAELDPITRRQLLDGEWVQDASLQPFRRAWWLRQNRYDPQDEAFWRHTVARFISWDTAFKDKDDSAYTACTVVELTADYRAVVREVWRAKLQFPDLVPAMEQHAARYLGDQKTHAILIEDRASGVSAYQTLQANASPAISRLLVAFEPRGSKEERAQQAAVWCRSGCVLLPHPSGSVPWLADFEHELFAFPHSADKDQVDSFSQAVLFIEHLLSTGHHARESQRTEVTV